MRAGFVSYRWSAQFAAKLDSHPDPRHQTKVRRDIEEQAMVDGCSRAGAVVRTVLPLAVPGLFTVVIFTFAFTMNDFIYAVAFISSSNNMTVSAGVPTELIRGDVFFWQSLMAAAVLVAIPVALAYNFFLDRFVQGLSLGAVKG